MPISPAAAERLRRFQRTFWEAFMPAACAVVLGFTALVAVFVALVYLNNPKADSFSASLDPHLPNLPFGGILADLAVVVTLYLLLLTPLLLAVLVGSLLHILLVVEPAIPLPLEQTGETILKVRARLKPPGQWLGAAGHLHLTRKFLVFVPHRWRLLASSGPPVEEVMIPLDEIASMHRGRTTLGRLMGLRIVRPSGDEEHLRVWRSGRFSRWLEQARSGGTPAAASPAHQRRWRVAITLLICAMLLYFVGWHAALRVMTSREYARIRGEGLPVTLAELAQANAPPKGDNAATLYLEAAEALSTLAIDPALAAQLPDVSSDPEVVEPALGEPCPPGMRKAMEAYLALHRPVLDKVHQASAIAECRYPVDHHNLAGLLMADHPSRIRRLALPLQFSAKLAAERSDSESAMEAVLDMERLAASLSHDPSVLSRIIAFGLESSAVRTLEHCLARTRFSDAQLATLSERLKPLTSGDGLQRAWVGDRCTALAILENNSILRNGIPNWGPMLPINGPIVDLWIASGLRDLDRLAMLRAMRANFAMHREPAFIPRAEESTSPVLLPLSNLAMTHSKSVEASDRSARVEATLALVALAAKRRQLAHGSLPDRLEQLVPEFLGESPRDLFDGQPLRYKRTERGALIYSVGPNLEDEGGSKLAIGRDSRQPRDIVFEVFEKP
ncbi:MAG: hypothetical protein NTW19_24000 [Planctomycetota bacterium]|nr:hypothetical protein [Planctomycetota bacterium]